MLEEMDEMEKEELEVVSGKGKIVIIVVGIILAALAVFLISFCMYYRNRWYMGTTIAGVEVSGKTMEESKKDVLEQFKGYSLVIKGRDDKTVTITDTDINLEVNVGEDWDETFSSQHEDSFVPLAKSDSYESALQVTYDENALTKLLEESVLIKGSEDSPVVKPVSAKVVFDKKKNFYVCKQEVQGNHLKKDVLLNAVKESLEQCEAELSLDNNPAHAQIYDTPKVTSEDQALKEEVTKRNKVILRFVTWNMTKGVKEKLTPKTIAGFISYKNGKVKYKNKAIEKWVKKFCGKYETVTKTRTFKSHTGKKVKVNPGDYGWQMDYEKTLTQVKKAIKKKIDSKYINAYIKEQSAANKKAITLLRTPTWLNKGYQWNSEKPSEDWDTKNFVEVSLAEQKVYVIRNGKVKFSCRCISGLPVPGRQTRTGAFYLKEHLPSHTMVGADYRTFVHWWVRITWTGTGFHPATWQPWGSWSPTLYRSRGSHGCINLAPSDAVTIYNLTKYYEMVFIH